jgi:hypothetical protein
MKISRLLPWDRVWKCYFLTNVFASSVVPIGMLLVEIGQMVRKLNFAIFFHDNPPIVFPKLHLKSFYVSAFFRLSAESVSMLLLKCGRTVQNLLLG